MSDPVNLNHVVDIVNDDNDDDVLLDLPPNPNHILPSDDNGDPDDNNDDIIFNNDINPTCNPLYSFPFADSSKSFVFFWGGYQSQWHRCTFNIEGQNYNTCEQFMMCEKARLFGDWSIRKEILRASNPKTQKALGRKVAGFKEGIWLRER